ncbi:unannotated protein [freshwater metagenome]|uniref:Unannotated protein n=1 Tax=freshwater metagenome TaxID=449393 RepID=A0A6J6DG67_9ZZZZ
MTTPGGRCRPAEFFIALDLPILSGAVRHAAADLLVGEGRSVAEHDRCQPGKRHHEQSQRTVPARNHQGPLCLKNLRSNRSIRPNKTMRAPMRRASTFTGRASKRWLRPLLGAKRPRKTSPSSKHTKPHGNACSSSDSTTPTKHSIACALAVNPTTNRSSPTSTTSSANLNSRSTDFWESNPNQASLPLESMHFSFHGRTVDSLLGSVDPRLRQAPSKNCAQFSLQPTRQKCGVDVHRSRFPAERRPLRSKPTPAMFSDGSSPFLPTLPKTKSAPQPVGFQSSLRGRCRLLLVER